jgi:hypothetical protein
VAKEFGLSDVGLAKVCRKLGVKKPARGFWAKVASGMPLFHRHINPYGQFALDLARPSFLEAA